MFTKNNGEKTSSVAFRDLVLNSFIVFILIIALLIPHVNIKGKNADGDIAQPGQMYVTMSWPSDNNIDLDLIIRDPTDEVVFFRNTHGRNLTLSKDDRGLLDDASGLNFEYLFSRSLPDGYYTINVVAFSVNEGRLPVETLLQVSVKDLKLINKRSEEVITVKKTVDQLNKEYTITRFLVVNGKIKTDTITNYEEDIIPEIKFSN